MKAPFYKPFKSFLIYDPNDPVQLHANEQGVFFLFGSRFVLVFFIDRCLCVFLLLN